MKSIFKEKCCKNENDCSHLNDYGKNLIKKYEKECPTCAKHQGNQLLDRVGDCQNDSITESDIFQAWEQWGKCRAARENFREKCIILGADHAKDRTHTRAIKDAEDNQNSCLVKNVKSKTKSFLDGVDFSKKSEKKNHSTDENSKTKNKKKSKKQNQTNLFFEEEEKPHLIFMMDDDFNKEKIEEGKQLPLFVMMSDEFNEENEEGGNTPLLVVMSNESNEEKIEEKDYVKKPTNKTKKSRRKKEK